MSGRWPSLSFVALVLAWSASLGFLAWGFTTPELDEIWQLRYELRAGRKANLSEAELAQLERALGAYPRLAEDWLDGARLGLLSAAEGGWLRAPGAVLLRAPRAEEPAARLGTLRLDVQVAQEHLPLAVGLRCGSERVHLRCERTGSYSLTLPAGEAALCQLELTGPDGHPLVGPPSVRLRLPEEP
jgi:hypothetical protein